MSSRRRSLIALAVLAAAGACPGTAGAASVGVFDEALSPSRIAIAPGESVTWINGGRQAHTVISERDVWPPLTVRPGEASRAIAFPRPGRYPYAVDGRLEGAVVVSRRLAGRREGGHGRRGGRRGRGGSETAERLLRFRVTARGEMRSTTYDPATPEAGERVVSKRWLMTFRDVRISVRRIAGAPLLIEAAPLTRGTVTTAYTYRDTERTGPDDPRPDCVIDGDYPNMLASLSLTGNASGRGLAGSIALRADHRQADVLDTLSRAAANFACPEREPGSPLGHGSDLGPILLRGVTLDGHPHPPNVQLTREWRSAALRAPADDLVSRRRFFHYDTGLHTRTLVSGEPSTVPTCPDPAEPCEVERLGKRLEVTFRRRR